jgi:hypothetical protein
MNIIRSVLRALNNPHDVARLEDFVALSRAENSGAEKRKGVDVLLFVATNAVVGPGRHNPSTSELLQVAAALADHCDEEWLANPGDRVVPVFGSL